MRRGRKRKWSPPVELIRRTDGFSAFRPDRESPPPDLDLGGIGKGFALDSLRPVLADWDITDALIHGGTSTALAIGRPDTEQEGWPVGVGGGRADPGIPKRIQLSNRALSGSGLEVKGAHITDPRTGKSARGHTAAWVSHPSAAESDALSTAFMVMNDREIGELCRKRLEIWALTIGSEEEYRLYNPDALKENTLSLEDMK
jgi:thiamine biosynthesis lipoprotein